MKLCTYRSEAGLRVGIVDGDTIIDGDLPYGMAECIARWPEAKATLEKARHAGKRLPRETAQLAAPVARPGKIFAIGLNYADHVAESGAEPPKEQIWFTKAVTAINGPHDPIQIPKISPFVDYEVELVAVIGKGGRHIAKQDAAAHIFGYCVGNDVTERLWQHRTPQWSLGKSFDTHAPIGPWITTADEVADPHALNIRSG